MKETESLEAVFYTPHDLAERHKLHVETVRKLFRDEPGVIRLGHSRGRRRQYFTLRIPASAAERVFRRMTVRDPVA